MGPSAHSRQTHEERTAISDRRMTEAAVELLVEKGIGGTTFALIGEMSGYSRGLVTYRFGSKAGLLAHVHDTVAKHWLARVQAVVGEAVGVVALERVVTALEDYISDEPQEIRAMYMLRYASIDPAAEYRANVAKVHLAQRRDAQRWIEAGQVAGSVASHVDARLAAEAFCSAADGIIYRWLVNPRIPVKTLHERLRLSVREMLETP